MTYFGDSLELSENSRPTDQSFAVEFGLLVFLERLLLGCERLLRRTEFYHCDSCPVDVVVLQDGTLSGLRKILQGDDGATFELIASYVAARCACQPITYSVALVFSTLCTTLLHVARTQPYAI